MALDPGQDGEEPGSLEPRVSHGSCHCPKKKVIAVGIVESKQQTLGTLFIL